MWHLILKINKNLTSAIPLMMISGFIYGFFLPADILKTTIVPFTFLMVYPMMVNLKISKVLEGGDTKAQILTQTLNFALIPFLCWGAGLIFFKDHPYMALGLLLAGLVPTSGMTISWTGFAKGNVEAAIKMTVIGLSLGSLLTPIYLKFLIGTSISMDFMLVIRQILFIVFLPMLAGFITQKALIKAFGSSRFQNEIAPKFPGLSTIGVLGIVFVAIALKAKTLAQDPYMLLFILLPLAIIYFLNFLISTLVAKFFLPRNDAIAMIYGSVMRNLSIALAIAINAFGPEGAEAALVVALAYIIQVQSAAWYVKFTDKILGPAQAK